MYIYMSLMVITHQKSILDIHTEKREKNPSVTLRIVIKSQGKRAKQETKKKHENNWNGYTTQSNL